MPFTHGARGERIHYEVHGDEGAWVVMIMGVGASSAMWLDLPRRLAAGGRRVLTIDNLGTGQSDPLRRPTTVQRMAGDVVHVMNIVGAREARVVGLSMGGMIAQHIALRHPARVSGLVLLATTPGVRFGGPPGARAIRGLLRSATGPTEGRAQRAVRDLILARADSARADDVLSAIGPSFGTSPLRPEALALQLLACAGHSTGRELKKILAPTLVLTGDDDSVVHRRASRYLAAHIPNASLEIIPRCGHGITFTHPEVVERAIARLDPATQEQPAYANG